VVLILGGPNTGGPNTGGPNTEGPDSADHVPNGNSVPQCVNQQNQQLEKSLWEVLENITNAMKEIKLSNTRELAEIFNFIYENTPKKDKNEKMKKTT